MSSLAGSITIGLSISIDRSSVHAVKITTAINKQNSFFFIVEILSKVIEHLRVKVTRRLYDCKVFNTC